MKQVTLSQQLRIVAAILIVIGFSGCLKTENDGEKLLQSLGLLVALAIDHESSSGVYSIDRTLFQLEKIDLYSGKSSPLRNLAPLLPATATSIDAAHYTPSGDRLAILSQGGGSRTLSLLQRQTMELQKSIDYSSTGITFVYAIAYSSKHSLYYLIGNSSTDEPLILYISPESGVVGTYPIGYLAGATNGFLYYDETSDRLIASITSQSTSVHNLYALAADRPEAIVVRAAIPGQRPTAAILPSANQQRLYQFYWPNADPWLNQIDHLDKTTLERLATYDVNDYQSGIASLAYAASEELILGAPYASEGDHIREIDTLGQIVTKHSVTPAVAGDAPRLAYLADHSLLLLRYSSMTDCQLRQWIYIPGSEFRQISAAPLKLCYLNDIVLFIP